MSLMEAHLREIELCTSTIAELHFAPPKAFTNAVLFANDITALIRDTEAHERALFSVTPLPLQSMAAGTASLSTSGQFRPPPFDASTRRSAAVAAVLGGDMAERLRLEQAAQSRSTRGAAGGDPSSAEVDVELLLKGAERICSVYPIPGALEKIGALRIRYRNIKSSVDHLEGLVADQTSQLRQMKRPSSRMSEYDGTEPGSIQSAGTAANPSVVDIGWEEEEVRDLELKKRALEDRLRGMEKDLGGLMT